MKQKILLAFWTFCFQTVFYAQDNQQFNAKIAKLTSPCIAMNSVVAVSGFSEGRANRYWYKIDFKESEYNLMKFEITANGIKATTVFSSTISSNFKTVEATLSSDGTMLAFANGTTGASTTDIVIIHIDTLAGNPATTKGNQRNGTSVFDISGFPDAFTGVEFSPNGRNLFVGQINTGIFSINVTNVGFGLQSMLIGTANHGNSCLELIRSPAGNFIIYAGRQNSSGTYDLGAILDPNSFCSTFQSNMVINMISTQ